MLYDLNNFKKIYKIPQIDELRDEVFLQFKY